MSETPELDALFRRQLQEFTDRMRAIYEYRIPRIKAAIECAELDRMHTSASPSPHTPENPPPQT